MSTPKQLEANRRNSTHSTGPRTDSGKATSSMNALKSGIHAQSQVIKGESAEALEALAAEYHAHHCPATPGERALVDILISSEWLLRRLRAAEAEIWNRGLQFIEDSEFQRHDLPLGDTFANKQETLARLQRRIDSADRSYHRSLQALTKLQAAPKQPQSEPQDHSQPVAAEPQSPEIGFVPSHHPAPLVAATRHSNLPNGTVPHRSGNTAKPALPAFVIR